MKESQDRLKRNRQIDISHVHSNLKNIEGPRNFGQYSAKRNWDYYVKRI